MSVMDLAIIRETEGWRIGPITNQLYVGRAWSGSDSFTAPVILMEWTVLHCMALKPFSHQMYGNQGSLYISRLQVGSISFGVQYLSQHITGCPKGNYCLVFSFWNLYANSDPGPRALRCKLYLIVVCITNLCIHFEKKQQLCFLELKLSATTERH